MIALDGGVKLVAPGGAFIPSESVLVVADLHAGYVQTLQKRGYTLPSQGDDDLIARVQALVDATDAAHVVVAGDLMHGRPALASKRGETSPVDVLLDRLAERDVTVVMGNHDRGTDALLAARGVSVVERFEAGAFVVMHGDEDPAQLRGERALAIERGGRLILGHHHPALTLDDGAGTRRRVPAFAHAPGLLCLPALAPLARGADLLREDYAEGICALATARELSVAVAVGAEVIPVGTLARVRAAYRGAPTGAAAKRR